MRSRRERPREAASTPPAFGWIAAATGAFVVAGMAYTLWWPAVVHHDAARWATPGDIWWSVRTAHWIDLGALSYVYSAKTALVTLPGFEVLLAPVVALASWLGLSTSPTGYFVLAKPDAWLLIGPVAMLSVALPLFASDALARTLGLSVRRRRVLVALETSCLWPVIVLWGHPEDVLAVGLCLWSLSCLLKGRLVAAAWLLGGALAMQLFVIVAVPVFVGALAWRHVPAFLARAALLPGVLLLAVLVPDPHATLHALFDQPNYPTVDHPTPWLLVAPHLAGGAVAAGPARLVGLALAAGLGVAATRYRTRPALVVWLAATALATRCLFEAVMDPYYVAPALAVGLVPLLMLRAARGRQLVAVAAAAAATVLAYTRPGMWWYWVEVASCLGVFLLAGRPRRRPSSLAAASVPGDPQLLPDCSPAAEEAERTAHAMAPTGR